MNLWLLLLAVSVPALAQPGFYRITGIEPGVRLFLNEDALADTAGQYPPGTYTLRVERPGFYSSVQNIDILSDQLIEIHVHTLPRDIKALPPRKKQEVRMLRMTGKLVLTSIPPDQPVWLDETAYGKTPVVLQEVAVGEHVVKIGEISGTFAVRVFETVRLRLENDIIRNVTLEDIPEELREVRIDSLALFMEEQEDRAIDCSNFYSGKGNRVFRLEREGMFLVCRMKFHLPKSQPTTIPIVFRLYRGSKLINEVEHPTRIDPANGYRVCYFHHEWWKTGEYVLTIDTAAGNRLADVRLTVYR